MNLTLPPTYPFKPPTVTFTTKIYHPNISNDSPPNSGTMCLGMLRDTEWKPSTKMIAVLEFARQLLKGMSATSFVRLVGFGRFSSLAFDELTFGVMQNPTSTTPLKQRSQTSTAATRPVTRRKPGSGASVMRRRRSESIHLC
jgi:hypothetical protein